MSHFSGLVVLTAKGVNSLAADCYGSVQNHILHIGSESHLFLAIPNLLIMQAI